MIKRQYIFFTSIIMFCIMMLFSCKNEMENIIKMSEIQKMPELAGENIYLTQTEYGKNISSIYTPKVLKYSRENSLYNTPRTIFPEGIKVTYFDQYPDTSSMIRADYAILYENEKKWKAKNNIVAKNSKGEVLHTEFLIWDQKKGTIHSDKQVQIITSDDIIEGNGFEADENFENWEIKNVTGIFTFDETTASNDSIQQNN
ncbi:MAG: LPS export ABC transporter periplasmic protein LptC [Bacteroidales bacterium]